MRYVNKFTVVPRLPEKLAKLLPIANNVAWCWNHDAHDLFFRIDRELWAKTNQNPRRLLGEVSQYRLDELASDDSFLAQLDRVATALEQYLAGNHWFERNPHAPKGLQIAYFSAEFGLHESLCIYSGGLGVLAGDHLKAASDLSVPLIAIGLLYREGYFRQYLNADGWQQELYPKNDFHNMPIQPARDASGRHLVVEVEYPNRMVKAYVWCRDVGISLDRLLELGRQNPADHNEPFCMTVLALKLSAGANGVSKLHGEVARDMWAPTWRDLPKEEVPITSITNGVHVRTWISRDMADLFDRYLGPAWINNPGDHNIWKRISEIPDTELWRTHERRRERLVDFARKRLHAQYAARGANAAELRVCDEVLNPEYLTIGFARRFATYKRGNLMLRDLERIKGIINNAKGPVQFIIAGKAHPADTQGKQIIRDIVRFARDPEVRYRVVYIEDYDMQVARYLVQGVDCWLNTPRRPNEASGTSGMKAAVNGALNISIPDGWWCEAEDLGPNGWSIGKGETYETLEMQDEVEADALYEILEQEASPLFYARGVDGLPREWIARMKCAIGTIGPMFNTYRMVQEYCDRFYVPCATRKLALIENHREKALALAAWKATIRHEWPHVRVTAVESGPTEGLPVGANLQVTASVYLAGLRSTDVLAEVYFGGVDTQGTIIGGAAAEMKCVKDLGDGNFRFEGAIHCEKTGSQGYTVRLVPSHPDLFNKHELALITWA